jgi:tetratricopeptide (TPR) repeat protein
MFAWAGISSANAGATRFDRAVALERQGKLAAALATLQTSSLTSAQKERRAHLSQALRIFHAAAVYTRLGEFGQAHRLLKLLVAKLDPVRDLFLERAAYRRLERLGALARRRGDQEASTLIEKAATLEEHGRLTQAAATYKLVAQSRADTVSAGIRQEARLGQLGAEAAAADRNSAGFKDDVWSSLRTVVLGIVKWLAIAAAIGLLIALLAGARGLLRSKMRRRGRTTISVSDLSAEPKDRNLKNHLLTRDLADEVYSAAGGGGESSGRAEIDERRDLDGAALPMIRIAEGTELIDSLISDETPVKLGPVALSPRELVYFVRWYFRRRGDFELIGTLRGDTGRTTITVERISVGERGRVVNRWHITKQGENSRSKAILDVATRIAVDLGGSYISSNWESFREYRAALGELAKASGAERAPALEAARASLQRALNHDPLNLLARVSLGSVLQLLGRNEEAIANYRRLEAIVTETELASATAINFVERHPELAYVAMYNRAVALSKIARWDCQNSARETLALLAARVSEEPTLIPALEGERDQLITKLNEQPEQTPLEEPDRRRLELLARAAWASTLVFLAEHTQTSGPDEADRGRRRREALLEKLEEVRGWIKRQSASPSDDPRVATATQQAEATVDNAYGRILSLLDRLDEASEALQNALSLLPDLGDAYVNMASVRMAKRARRSGWEADAERDLKRALEISPDDEKARVLLGDLYADPALRRYRDAAACYEQLPGDPIACFKLAELRTREGKPHEAIDLFSRSLSQRPVADFRAERYLETVLSMQRTDLTPEQLHEARLQAQRLAQQGASAHLKRRGREFAEQLRRTRTVRRTTTKPRPKSSKLKPKDPSAAVAKSKR